MPKTLVVINFYSLYIVFSLAVEKIYVIFMTETSAFLYNIIYSGIIHQQPLKDTADILSSNGIVVELNGALTHTPPKGAQTTILQECDMEGKKVLQHIMHEAGVIPINIPDFKESQEKTLYLQENIPTGRMIANASPSSVMNTNNATCSTLLAKNYTPLDDNF
jgi:hypothetical protein